MNSYRELSDADIKKELINMLREVDSYMRDNQFQYTIFAGTLLGAVRHKGFIPWDDDIDIAMLRPEYEKMLKKIKNDGLINDHLTAVGYELGNGEIPYIKIVNKKIKTEEYISPYSSEQGYLWIDVFPLDGVPKNNIENYYRMLKQVENKYLGKRIYLHNWKMDAGLNKSFFRKLKSHIKWSFVSMDHITNKFIRLGRKYDVQKSEKVSNNLWGVGYKEAFSSKLMANIIDYEFECIKVKGIKNADEWLSIRYGDYMKLPPENERENHGLKAWWV